MDSAGESEWEVVPKLHAGRPRQNVVSHLLTFCHLVCIQCRYCLQWTAGTLQAIGGDEVAICHRSVGQTRWQVSYIPRAYVGVCNRVARHDGGICLAFSFPQAHFQFEMGEAMVPVQGGFGGRGRFLSMVPCGPHHPCSSRLTPLHTPPLPPSAQVPMQAQGLLHHAPGHEACRR